jgi:predicted O-methyltransferase YrrM
MDQAVEIVLSEFEKRAASEREAIAALPPSEGSFRDPFMLAVGPATGQLLHLLVRELEPKSILEIGTSYGYSTVWLADAARAVSKHTSESHDLPKVTTLEIHPGKSKSASEAVAKAGLSGFVDFLVGDAIELIASLPGPFDFILLDLWKHFYIPCFDLFYPKLSPGALIVADNMIYPEFNRDGANEYRRHVRSKPHIESVLLEVGSGLELSRFTLDKP